jgi:CARDB protein
MFRRVLTAAIVTAAAAAVVAAPASGEGKPPASVKLANCSLDTRSALFIARMHQISGSDRLWLRFRLLEKSDTGLHPLKAPGLGRWRKSKPGVGTFAYKQAVKGLEAGSLYRAQVDYRWYDEQGNLLLTARRRSPACRQFDVLPNLEATPASVKALRQQGVVRYRILVTNEGIAPATDVPVRLTVDGDVVDTVTIASLAPAERVVVGIQGPKCTQSVKADVDPDGVIVESSESDNSHEVACSALPGA